MKFEPMNQIIVFRNEVFKEIEFDDKPKLRYAISNLGRLISFENDINFGRVLEGGFTNGYRMFRYKIFRDGKVINKHKIFYKLVAEYFVPKTSDDQVHVIHLDRQKDNNVSSNLKWVTKTEMIEFYNKSHNVIKARLKMKAENTYNGGHKKLTVTKVMLIKKLLANPERKTRLKMIAKQFGISEMQLNRIKRGENWGYVKV
jgi:hypothetical protein